MPSVQSRLFDRDRGVRPVEVVEPVELLADPLHPALDDLARVERALPRLLGVADQAGGAADQGERPVPVLLEPAHREDLHEVAQVQARRRRVEAAVQRDRPGRRGRAQRVEVGALRDQAAPGQFVDDRGHGVILPHPRARHSSRSVCPSMQLAVDVEVPVVPGQLLDHVDVDPAQRRAAPAVPRAGGLVVECVDAGDGPALLARDGVGREKRSRGCRPVPSRTPGRGRRPSSRTGTSCLAREVVAEPPPLDVDEVLEDPGDAGGRRAEATRGVLPRQPGALAHDRRAVVVEVRLQGGPLVRVLDVQAHGPTLGARAARRYGLTVGSPGR